MQDKDLNLACMICRLHQIMQAKFKLPKRVCLQLEILALITCCDAFLKHPIIFVQFYFKIDFCSLLRETTQVWLLQLYLPSLTESGGIDGPRQFGALTSHTLVEKLGVI